MTALLKKIGCPNSVGLRSRQQGEGCWIVPDYPPSTFEGIRWVEESAIEAGKSLGCNGIYWFPKGYSDYRKTPSKYDAMIRIRGTPLARCLPSTDGIWTSARRRERCSAGSR